MYAGEPVAASALFLITRDKQELIGHLHLFGQKDDQSRPCSAWPRLSFSALVARDNLTKRRSGE